MANEMTVQDMSNLSVAFAKSGLFGYKSSSEAFTLMAIAQANGLHPAKAAERYHIIQGRPAMKADAMLSAFQEAGGKVRWVKRTDTECVLHLEHPQGGELDVKWNMERANKAGLTGKSTWKQFPAQMLSARCVSEGVRALFPACLSGMYTPEEVQDFRKDDGDAGATVPEFVEATVDDVPVQEQADAVEAEVVQPEPPQATAQPAAPKAEKTQAQKDANWQKACAAQRDRSPEVFDNFLKAHNVKSVANIKDSASRKKFLEDVKTTIDNALQGDENGEV